MSPQIKRIALGSFVVVLTALLVLSAIAVAQRDSRNVADSTAITNPDYAKQEVEPLAMPADSRSTFYSDSGDGPFRDNDLDMSQLPSIGSPHASVESLPLESSAFAPLPISASESAVENSTPNPLRNAVRSANLRDTENIAYISQESIEDSADVHQESSIVTLDDSDTHVRDASWEEEQVDSTEASHANESDVVQASGYGLPPVGQTAPKEASGNGNLLPPPMPLFSANNTAPSNGAMPRGSASPVNAPAMLSVPDAAQSLPSLPTTLPSLSSLPTMPNSREPQPSSSTAAVPNSLPSSLSTPAIPSPSQPVSSDASNNSFSAEGLVPIQRQSMQTQNVADAQSIPTPSLYANGAGVGASNLPNAANSNNQLPVEAPRARMASNASLVPQNVSGAIARESLTSEMPGERSLDGAQSPSLQIQKQAPQEIQVGHPATFTILVKNIGTVAANDVQVQDSVPQGTRLVATQPPANQVANGRLVWDLGNIAAGGQQVLTMEIVPEIEGEIGSVATVHFTALASVRTVSTQPKLTITQTSDPSVLIGEKAYIRINIANDGTGVAYDVSLEEDVPQGFRHPQGNHLGLQLNDLAPGQTRTVNLEMEATEAGIKNNLIRLMSSNADSVESAIEIEVVAPQIAINAEGPGMRYLERQATYQLSIMNQGTATARNVELKANLPNGLRFNSAGNGGAYLADQHAVVWMLEELAPGATAVTELNVLPVEQGDFVIRLQSRAERTVSEPIEKQVRVEGQSELAFTVEDDNDPIETGEQTTYAVRLTNVGTKNDRNIQVLATLPEGARIVDVKAPVDYQIQGNQLFFAVIPSMAPKDEQLFRFTVQLQNEGTQKVSVAVKSELRPREVIKEESTLVYHDL